MWGMKKQMSVRVTAQMEARINRLQAEYGMSRQALLIMALTLGLNQIARPVFVDRPAVDRLAEEGTR